MNDAAPSMPRKQRLKFIDLARAIAILLMLEGHFVGVVLMDEWRDTSYPIYLMWHLIRGFTAPLFFTVSGMIFVFLLTGEKDTPFFQSNRVKKGLRRALELLLWGYALQTTVRNFPEYFSGNCENWVFAFHVLQCIGVGLLCLILISGIRRAIGRGPLEWWYAAAVALVLVFYGWLKTLPDGVYVPTGWPDVLQNPIHGPRSVFPMAPWFGFAFLGGAMGAYLRSREVRPANGRSCLWFFYLGSGMLMISVIANFVASAGSVSAGIAWFAQRSFQVVVFVGILRVIEIRFGIGLEWLLRTGRETFGIYIIHVVVLYGGIFGLGLNDVFRRSLNPWQAAAGAILFLAGFIAYAQVWGFWKKRWKQIRDEKMRVVV